MLALFAAVFIASLLGSTHCAGMCGAFVAFAVGAGDPDGPGASKAVLNAAYNLGRLATYAVLGTFAGLVGAALDLGGSMVGVQRAAAVFAGVLMIGFGVVAVLRQVGVRVPRMPLPGVLTRLARAGHERAFALGPVSRAGAVGLLTTLLPCGWLYAFVITAAGTADPLTGALTMAAFWLGTLPIMAALGIGASHLTGPLRRHMPLLTSLLLVGVGVYTVSGRMHVPVIATAAFDGEPTIDKALHAGSSPDKHCPLCNTSK
jgi:sulfite exporter TauE/SafE